MTPTCNVFGDSHVWALKEIPGVEVTHLGPRTMYHIGREGLDIKDSELTIYVFGEIDCRCHIGRIRDTTGESQTSIINRLTDAYFKAIKANKGIGILYSIVGATTITEAGSQYNPYGTLEDRIQIIREMNTKLRQSDLPMLDICDHYNLPSGELDPRFRDPGIHIDTKHNGYIREKLDQLLKELYKEN
jgi:hypothetical protein